MTSRVAALVVLVVSSLTARAELAVARVEACHGRFGPVRTGKDFFPNEEVMFRFLVTGARTDDEGRIDAEVSWMLFDAKGTVVLRRSALLRGPAAFGSESFPASLAVLLPETAAPGEYTLRASVKDRIGGEQAVFERSLVLRPVEFALVSPRFSYDAAGTAQAPAGGLVGQVLHFRVWAVGFDRAGGKIDLAMEVQVLDRARRELLPKPLAMAVKNEDPRVVKELPAVDLGGSLLLNQAGEYTLRIGVADRAGNRQARWECPLVVREP